MMRKSLAARDKYLLRVIRYRWCHLARMTPEGAVATLPHGGSIARGHTHSPPLRGVAAVYELLLAAGLLLIAGPVFAAELSAIQNVAVSKAFFNPYLGERIGISSSLDRPGSLSVLILDRDGFPVRRLVSDKQAEKGLSSARTGTTRQDLRHSRICPTSLLRFPPSLSRGFPLKDWQGAARGGSRLGQSDRDDV